VPTPEDVVRAKSTRDILLAPLRPTARQQRVHEMVDPSVLDLTMDDVDRSQSSDEELFETFKVRPFLHQLLTTILIEAGEQRSGQATQSKWRLPSKNAAFDMAELDDWENRIIWDADEDGSVSLHRHSHHTD